MIWPYDHPPRGTCEPGCPLYGICHCGCGQPTKLAPSSSAARSCVGGRLRVWLRGHASRLPKDGSEAAEQAREVLERLVAAYGSVAAVGRAYSARFSLRERSGERQLSRIRAGRAVRAETLDRLETLWRSL